MQAAVLTTPNQWFVPYAEKLAADLGIKLFFRHEDVTDDIDVLLILSYHRIIPECYLTKRQHNIVIHAADLPDGKGWAPLFWQVIEGKSDIVFTLFEADTGMDSGPFYLKRTLHLSGHELNEELRHLQADMCVQMCKEYMANIDTLKAQEQDIYAISRGGYQISRYIASVVGKIRSLISTRALQSSSTY